MYHCGMRQMEERHVANQIDIMLWSNRLDLLALSNFKGEVQVHRLQWQKVWNLPPPKENVTVQAMAWRPDGKALAIGYSSGIVLVVDIEDKDILDKHELYTNSEDELNNSKNFGISCITWMARAGDLESASEYNLYDDASIFLQKPSSLGTGYKNQSGEDTVKDIKEIKDQTHLNVLMVGYGSGRIYISIFGRYPYGTINLNELVKDEFGEFKILDVILSDDFSMMQVFYLDVTTDNLLVALINTSVLSAYAEEIFSVANKHGQVVQLISHLDQTMVSITEAWEHILLEMDNKMAYYASSVPEGGVSADLLELLMLGVPSDALEVFLLQDLTTKGLKKFGSSVELSYSTIQKLVLKQLNIVGQNIAYYLAELRGSTRVPDRYKILGIEERKVTEAIKASCAFLNKCLELQQVIDISMRNYKAFFRWLFVVIVRLLDEQTPSEIVKITQQELTHIAEFLYDFDNSKGESSNKQGTEKPVKFNLERLGQYLQDQDLTILPDDEDNPWQNFLKENVCLLKDNDTIYSMAEFKKFSLVQQQNFLKNAINKIFDVTEKDIGNHFSILYNIRCYEDKANSGSGLRVSQIFDANQQRFIMAFMNAKSANDGICFMSSTIQERSCNATAVKYYFTPSILQDSKEQSPYECLSVFDLQFYSTEYLSVLIQHPDTDDNTIFVQLPLKIALDNSNEFNVKSKSCIFGDKVSRRNISPLLDQGVYKVLDKMDGCKIAVSGGRKVAVVLSRSYRKVRVFEMEADGDDDEEETLDITPQSLTARTSQGTPEKSNVSTDNLSFFS